jgi:LysR family transcriptional regulator, glycine cleavage system transcriptional activator
VLPSLSLTALRAFEAAARLGSFTKAAGELAMTQGAVSYQVKQLEGRLGAALFHRAGRSVELTPVGKRLSASLTEAFGLIRSAYSAAADHSSSRLLITALPTVASNWLVPRLASFQVAQPALSVRLDTSVEIEDLRASDFDVAIRSGGGNWPGCEAHRLFANDYTVVCAPALVRARKLSHPADLEKVPLFGGANWWTRWLSAAGIPVASVEATDLGTQTSEVKAALMREGAALVTPLFFREEIEAEVLAQPFKILAKSPSDYWLVYRHGEDSRPNVRSFKQWIMREIAVDD